ncbi:uncharacterized protein LOC118734990 [Rhagoletis pomonella]|uniref:uncharacterized protein LOC118734990 n=1 Tax=Rhagoletis pomonella TaxID=28610 RepID=UPI00177D1CE3|nr:uncharacterized protein LOC118734990 [Rhagoletis pomonella]
MDKILVKKFKECGLLEYVDIFEDEEIFTEIDFKLLSNEKIEQLFPLVSQRNKFRASFREFLHEILTKDINQGRAENDVSDFYSSSSDSENSKKALITGTERAGAVIRNESIDFNESDAEAEPPKKARTESGKKYLLDLLKQTCDGKIIISRYKKNKILNDKTRNSFSNIIVHNEFAANPNTVICTARFIQLSQSISELFPNEDKETYYIPAQRVGLARDTILAKGKLWNQFTTFSRDLRECSLRKIRPTEIEGATIGRIHPRLPETHSGSENIASLIEFLRTHLEPWAVVTENWRITCSTRLNQLCNDTKYEQIADYILEYPVLKQPLGYKLFESDFDTLYPDAAKRMMTHWTAFKEKVQFEVRDNEHKTIESDAEVLNAFAGLLPSVPLKVPKGKAWKASKQDMKEGFLLHIKRIQDFEKTLKFVEEKYFSKGITVQGFPMVVGADLKTIESSYFVLDRTPFLLESPTRAVEVAFKAFHALYSPYSTVSCRSWLILQESLFGIVGYSDKYAALMKQPEVIRLMRTLRV